MNNTFQATDGLSSSTFPDTIPTYTGHYHKPHTVGESNIRYVGSPYQGACPAVLASLDVWIAGQNAVTKPYIFAEKWLKRHDKAFTPSRMLPAPFLVCRLEAGLHAVIRISKQAFVMSDPASMEGYQWMPVVAVPALCSPVACA